MTSFGYTLSSEEHPPRELVRNATRAAKIANSPDASKHGGEQSGKGGNPRQGGTTAQRKAAGRKGGKASARKK